MAARITATVGNVARFPTKAHFASYSGTAPVEASSGEEVRHRLSLGGNGHLNYALHMVATSQARSDAPGGSYYRKKIAEGKFQTVSPRTRVNTRSGRWLGALECAIGDHRMRLQKLYNPVVASILRSPLHGLMSKSVMLLTYRGRRSGRSITTPISYVQDGKDLLAVASRDHAWWKNLRGGAPVRVRLRGRQLEGTGGTFEGEAAKEGLLDVLRAVPAYRRHWGVELDEGGQPKDPAAILRIARENALVKISDLTEAEST